MAKVKFGNFDLKPEDFDLQVDTPPTGFGRTGFIYQQISNAKKKAIEMMTVRIGPKLESPLTLEDFKCTKEAMDKFSGKHIGVEWACEKAGKAQGERGGTWTIIIDMDDIPEGATPNGPDRPHVGYSYWYKANNSAFNVGRINGHIFVNEVPASRNLGERAL